MINPDPKKDQFILTDQAVLRGIVEAASLRSSDTVLEIGAGPGNLTSLLAERAGKVIAIEKDPGFAPELENMPNNVEVLIQDARSFVSRRGKYMQEKVFNKIVSNLPYSMCEWLLHQLTFIDYDKAILLVPKIFAEKINDNPVFGSFFQAVQLLPVHKSKFSPVPRTDSVLIDLQHLPDPLATSNLGLFLRQHMYQHEAQIPRNALVEGIIRYAAAKNRKLTKNQARDIIADKKMDQKMLDLVLDYNWDIYGEVGRKFTNLDIEQY